jgi:integrase
MAQKFQKVANQPNLFLDLDSGIYYVRVMIRGRVKWRSTRKTTPKQAISEARQILGQLEEGREAKRTIPTLAEFWPLYREAKEKQHSPATRKLEQRIMELHVLPHLGPLGLDEITPMQIERLFNWRRKQKAPRGNVITEGSVTREEAVLAAVLNAAVKEQHLDRSPMADWKPSAYKARQRVVSREEQTKLEAVMSPMLQRWLRFRLLTGLRCEELEGLIPDRDIDWEGNRFKVTGKGYRGVKKVRWVPFLPQHVAEIRELIAAQRAENEVHAKRSGDGPLWPQSPRVLSAELAGAVKRAKLAPGISPHVLRHTFATRYLQAGGDIYTVSQILGHSSIRVTESVYAHLRTEDLAAQSKAVKMW